MSEENTNPESTDENTPVVMDDIPIIDGVSITVVPMWQDTVVIKGCTYEIAEWRAEYKGKLVASLDPVGYEINDNPGIPNEKIRFLSLPMRVAFHGESSVTDSEDLTVNQYGLLVHMDRKIIFDDPWGWLVEDINSVEEGRKVDVEALKSRIAETYRDCVFEHMTRVRNRAILDEPRVNFYVPGIIDDVEAGNSFTLMPGLEIIYAEGWFDPMLYVLGYIRLTDGSNTVHYTLAVEYYVAKLLNLNDPNNNEMLSVLGFNDQVDFRFAVRHYLATVYTEKDVDFRPAAIKDIKAEWVAPRRFWKDKVLSDYDNCN